MDFGFRSKLQRIFCIICRIPPKALPKVFRFRHFCLTVEFAEFSNCKHCWLSSARLRSPCTKCLVFVLLYLIPASSVVWNIRKRYACYLHQNGSLKAPYQLFKRGTRVIRAQTLYQKYQHKRTTNNKSPSSPMFHYSSCSVLPRHQSMITCALNMCSLVILDE